MSASLSTAPPPFRSRIGRDARSGHYPVPGRYRLHLALSCPSGLEVALTHALLGLADTLPLSLLPAVPDAPGGGYRALRLLYENSAHQHPGPAVPPVLSDTWTGRVVSTHAPDIIRDLALRFGGGVPDLDPSGAAEELAAIGLLCDQDVTASAQRAGRPGAAPAAVATLLSGLGTLEQRLTSRPYMLGHALTLADVKAWVTLLYLDTVHRRYLDAETVSRLDRHPRLWAYASRLAALPAFGAHLDLDGIARRHRARCPGRAPAGATPPLVDWAA